MPSKPKNIERPWIKKPDQTRGNIDKRYNTRQWQRLRKLQLTKHPLCIECQKQNLVVPATVADHITQVIKDGEFWDLNNLQSLCSSCHGRKSSKEGRQ